MPSSSLFLLLLLVLSSPAAAHRPPTSYASSALTEWRSAKASYYAAADPRDTVGQSLESCVKLLIITTQISILFQLIEGGACGYGDLGRSGYGMATVGLSEALYEKGQACGGCYEVRCVDELKYCIPGTTIVVTATNYCAPNFGLPADSGGVCNPPNHHFVMPIAAFEKIAIWKAGVIPIQYRRSVL